MTFNDEGNAPEPHGAVYPTHVCCRTQYGAAVHRRPQPEGVRDGELLPGRLGRIAGRSHVQTTVRRESPASVPTVLFVRRRIKVPLSFKLLERMPVPLLADEFRMTGHQLLEAVNPGGLHGVGITETNAEQV